MKSAGGRPCIYGPKDGDRPYRALKLTARGQALFESARTRLQKVTKWGSAPTDADVIEFLVRGEKPPKDRQS